MKDQTPKRGRLRAALSVIRNVTLAFLVVMLLAGASLWTGWPQQAIAKRVIKSTLGFEAEVGTVKVRSPLTVSRLALYDVDHGVVAALPTVEIGDISVDYTLSPLADRYIDSVDVASIDADFVFAEGEESNINVLQDARGRSRRQRGGQTDITAYIPRQTRIRDIALSLESPEGTLSVAGINAGLNYRNFLTFTGSIESGNATGAWSIPAHGIEHAFSGGAVDIRVQCRQDGLDAAPMKIVLPDFAELDGNVEVGFYGMRNSLSVTVDTLTLHRGAAALLSGVGDIPPLEFERIDVRDSQADMWVSVFNNSLQHARLDVHAVDLRVGDEGRALYSGNLTILGEMQESRGTFDITLGQGQKLGIEIDTASEKNRATLVVDAWSREALANALPETARPALDSFKALEQVSMKGIVTPVESGYDFTFDAIPELAGPGDSPFKAALTLAGAIATGDTAGPFLAATGELKLPNSWGKADVELGVSRSMSEISGKLTLNAVAAAPLAALAGLTPLPEIGTLDGRAELEAHPGTGEPATITCALTGDIETFLGALGLSLATGTAAVQGDIAFANEGIRITPEVRLENTVVAGSYPLMAAPIDISGEMVYGLGSGQVSGEDIKVVYAGTTLTAASFAYSPAEKKWKAPFELATDLAPLTGLGWLQSANGMGKVTGTIASDAPGMTAKADVDLAAESLVFPGAVAAALDAVFKASISYTNGLEGSGQLSVREVAAAGAFLRDLSTPVRFASDGLRIEGMKAALFGGSATIDVDARLLAPGRPIRVKVDLDQIDLAAFTEEFKPPGTALTGLADGEVEAAIVDGALTGMRIALRATEGFSVNRDLVKTLLLSEYVTGIPLSGKVRGAIDKTIGEAAQRPFDSASLTLALEGDTLVGGAPLASKNLNLDIVLSIELSELYAALQLRQEAQLENIANIGLAPVE